jgi:RNA polymerase subunit RPABC4/transcription elongation factor Spt4
MDEEKIKSLRATFTTSSANEFLAPTKNKFGHTVLNNSDNNINEETTEVEIDSEGLVSANPKYSVFDSKEFNEFAEKIINSETHEDLEEVEPVEIKTVDLASLISELDEMDGTSNKFKPYQNPDGSLQIDPNTSLNWRHDLTKSCANKDCLYALPKDAKFCMKCGTAQMPKFCTECGYNFPGMEKFCPDCGTKRN